MAIRELGLHTLKDIDGGAIVAEFDRHLERARQDCADRPDIGKARKVVLEVSIVPDDTGSVVGVGFNVKSSMPKGEIQPYQMALKSTGITFSDAAPENPAQATFGGEDE